MKRRGEAPRKGSRARDRQCRQERARCTCLAHCNAPILPSQAIPAAQPAHAQLVIGAPGDLVHRWCWRRAAPPTRLLYCLRVWQHSKRHLLLPRLCALAPTPGPTPHLQGSGQQGAGRGMGRRPRRMGQAGRRAVQSAGQALQRLAAAAPRNRLCAAERAAARIGASPHPHAAIFGARGRPVAGMTELQKDDVVAVPLQQAHLPGNRPGCVVHSEGCCHGCGASTLPRRLPLLPVLLRCRQRLRMLLTLIGSGQVGRLASAKELLRRSTGRSFVCRNLLWRPLRCCLCAGRTVILRLPCCFWSGAGRCRSSSISVSPSNPSASGGAGQAADVYAQRGSCMPLLLIGTSWRRQLPLPHVHAAVVAASHDVRAIPTEPAHQQTGVAPGCTVLACCIRSLPLLPLLLFSRIPPPTRILRNRRLAEVSLLPCAPALPSALLLRLASRGRGPAAAQQAQQLALHVASGAHAGPRTQAAGIRSCGPGASNAGPAQAAQAAGCEEGKGIGQTVGQRLRAAAQVHQRLHHPQMRQPASWARCQLAGAPCRGVPAEPEARRVDGEDDGRGAGVARPPDAARAVKGGRQQGVRVGGVEVHKGSRPGVADEHRHRQARAAAAALHAMRAQVGRRARVGRAQMWSVCQRRQRSMPAQLLRPGGPSRPVLLLPAKLIYRHTPWKALVLAHTAGG